MRNPQPGVSTLGALLRNALARHEAELDGIVQGFGVVPASEPRPVRVIKGRHRGRAVAAHLRIQNRTLVRDWYEYSRMGLTGAAESLQAGAAATETLADVLEATMVGDWFAVRRLLERCVNDAVDSGVVTV